MCHHFTEAKAKTNVAYKGANGTHHLIYISPIYYPCYIARVDELVRFGKKSRRVRVVNEILLGEIGEMKEKHYPYIQDDGSRRLSLPITKQ